MGVDLNQDWEVLILVLVEDTLEALGGKVQGQVEDPSLNPLF